jgi:hypothetical protein
MTPSSHLGLPLDHLMLQSLDEQLGWYEVGYFRDQTVAEAHEAAFTKANPMARTRLTPCDCYGEVPWLELHHRAARYWLCARLPMLYDETETRAWQPDDIVDGIVARDLVRHAAARDLSIGVGHEAVQQFIKARKE